MKYTISDNRKTLTLTVDDQERDLLRQLEADEGLDLNSDVAMYDWFEGFLGNCELEWIDPCATGDLTSAPMLGILGEDATEEDIKKTGIEHYGLRVAGFWDGKPQYQPILERWAFMAYEVKSVMNELREHGKVEFTC